MLGPALFVLLSSPLLAQDLPALPGQGTSFSAGAELGAASRYVWRGMPASQGPTLQPAAWLSIENVTIMAWGNIDLDSGASRALSELDLIVSVSQAWEDLTFEPGLIAYVLPGVGSTAEAFGNFSWQPGPVGLYSNHAVDFWDARPGWWSESGALVSVDLPAQLWVDAGAGISLANNAYNEYYLSLDRFGSQYACATLGLGWAHSSGLYAGVDGRLDLLTQQPVRDALGVDMVQGSALLEVGWEGSRVWVRQP